MGMLQLEWTQVRKNLGMVGAMAGFALVVTSCYPGGPTDLSELDTVITLRAPNDSVYAANKTYAMPDTVIHFVDSTQSNQPMLDRSYDATLLQAVRDGMAGLGYREIPFDTTLGPEVPDVVMLVQATATNNWSAYVWFPWWRWWGGQCGPRIYC